MADLAKDADSDIINDTQCSAPYGGLHDNSELILTILQQRHHTLSLSLMGNLEACERLDKLSTTELVSGRDCLLSLRYMG